MAEPLRRAWRDVRLTPGHLVALAVGAVVWGGAAFSVGYRAGHADVTFAPSRASLTDDAAGHDLVDLLARVEAGANPDGGASQLTFPGALRGSAPPDMGPLAPPLQVQTETLIANPSEPVSADPAPTTRFVVEAGRYGAAPAAVALRDQLRAADLAAVATLELVGGERTWVVLVPGGADEAAAKVVALAVEAAVVGADVEYAEPVVVDLAPDGVRLPFP